MSLDFGPGAFRKRIVAWAFTTLKLTVVCILLGCSLGFIVGLARTSRSTVLRFVSGLYVEFFRGTPVLIQLFWIFFCLPLILGVELSNFMSGVIALTLYMGAITSETFRASLRSVGPEQRDACVALGLPHVSRSQVSCCRRRFFGQSRRSSPTASACSRRARWCQPSAWLT